MLLSCYTTCSAPVNSADFALRDSSRTPVALVSEEHGFQKHEEFYKWVFFLKPLILIQVFIFSEQKCFNFFKNTTLHYRQDSKGLRSSPACRPKTIRIMGTKDLRNPNSFIKHLFLMCMRICVHRAMHTKFQRRVPDSAELEVRMLVSLPMDAGNWTQDLLQEQQVFLTSNSPQNRNPYS